MTRGITFQEATTLAKSGNREAQYALSSVLHEHGRFDESVHWLRLAAAQKMIPAQLTLAAILIDGRQCPRDRQQAIDLLQPLAHAHVQANLLLSELYGFAALGGIDRETSLRFLLAAARLGDAGALRQLALLCVCHQRWHHVRPLFNAAARGGDAVAAAASACCYRDGIGGAPDGVLPEPPALNIAWSLLERELPLLAADIPLPKADILHEAPLIRRLRGVVHPLVLDALINVAAPLVQRSKIIDARTGEARADPMRNSAHVTFGPRNHDHVVEALERCISSAAGTPALNGEFLQILRYRVGEEFRPHVDYFNESAAGAYRSLADGGQRSQTVLIYLNEGYTGGDTRFPMLQISIQGRRGDMLQFHNVNAQGLGVETSLHAGMPVEAGEKWLLSQWIRSDAYPARLAW